MFYRTLMLDHSCRFAWFYNCHSSVVWQRLTCLPSIRLSAVSLWPSWQRYCARYHLAYRRSDCISLGWNLQPPSSHIRFVDRRAASPLAKNSEFSSSVYTGCRPLRCLGRDFTACCSLSSIGWHLHFQSRYWRSSNLGEMSDAYILVEVTVHDWLYPYCRG